MRLILIRHGQTDVNAQGLIHKISDEAGLNDIGKKQIESVTEVIKKNNGEIIFSSEEKRAVESAEIIARGIGKKHQTLSLLNERNWGDWQIKSWNEIEKFLNGLSIEKRYTFVPPNGESWQQMENRLQKALNIFNNQNTETVVIVTHGGALRGLMPLLTNSPRQTSLTYEFNNASITIFDYKDNRYNEIVVNDISHLKN